MSANNLAQVAASDNLCERVFSLYSLALIGEAVITGWTSLRHRISKLLSSLQSFQLM